MATFATIENQTGEESIETSLNGTLLLNQPLLNKEGAFSEEERNEFGLDGLIPPAVESLELQLERAYSAYQKKDKDLERYIYLRGLQDRNEILFYRLLQEHIEEMLPIIYTPTVGLGCQFFSEIYRKARGLFISYPNRNKMDQMLDNIDLSDVQVIVVSDGEHILGLGDLGANGMGIPIGKISLYIACGNLNPAVGLPILLDTGTDNETLLNDPLYLGWRNKRIRGKEYGDFVETFIQAITHKFPNVLLHWEDFAQEQAHTLLERYRNRLCTFNDDIQGTAAATLAGLLVAVKLTGSQMKDQKIVIYGSGSIGMGISDQTVQAMVSEGLSEQQARERIWLIDKQGLLHTAMEQFHPTILIGVSAQYQAFTEDVVREMAKHVKRPIIFPLSNPFSRCEADPKDLISWTEGRALVATGTKFPNVSYRGRIYKISQCNNSYIFPGMGLGVISSKAKRITDSMFLAAARVLSEAAPALKNPEEMFFPDLQNISQLSKNLALAIGLQAQKEGVAAVTSKEALQQLIQKNFWSPRYPKLIYKNR